MKHPLRQLLVLLPLLFLAASAAAYTNPTASAPGNNTNAPIDIGAANQVKPAGLSVTTFQGRGTGWLQQQTFVAGMIRGGTPGDINSQVTFGDATKYVSVKVSDPIVVKGAVQSDSLASNSVKNVCADAAGKLILCNQNAPSAVTGIVVYPYSNMTSDGEDIICEATLNTPSTSSQTLALGFNYTITTNTPPDPVYSQGGSGSCSLTFAPGQTYASVTAGSPHAIHALGQSLAVTSYCVQQNGTTVQNTSATPGC